MSWATMPVGIPTPPAILGQTRDEIYGAGYYTYWVNNLTGNDGTAGNGGKGTEALPRATIPTSLTAGDVVEIRGGPYTTGDSSLNFTGTGTSTQPIIIRGPDYANRVTVTKTPRLGGTYMICEYLKFNPNVIDDGPGSAAVASYCEFRYCEFSGSGVAEGGGSVISPSGSYCVVANCSVHDWGQWQSGTENDLHGLSCGTATFVWYLWNTIYHLGGDGYGNAHNANHAPHDHFFGGNTVYECRENAVDLKEIHNIIISENHCYNFTTSSTSEGAAIVLHYGPTSGEGPYNCWVLNNHIHDCVQGIGFSDSEQTQYCIGNVIHDCDSAIYANSTSLADIRSYHNTIYNCGYGVFYGVSMDDAEFVGNIVSAASTRHINVDIQALTNYGPYQNNCLYQGGSNVSILWYSTTYTSVASWISGRANCSGCIQADPKFVNAAGDNFALQSDSPCINAGYNMSAIEDIFAANWGTSLLKDIAGNPRPDGVWDIGAYEYTTSAVPGGTITAGAR